MKIFLDDIRDPPTPGWVTVRTVSEFLHLARSAKAGDVLSLDHDLGENKLTGYDALCQLEKEVVTEDRWKWRGMPDILIHSANPTGRENMERAIKSIVRFHSTGRV